MPARGGSDLIWQSGVVRGRVGRVWLEFDDPRACSQCSQGTGCGAALFSQLFQRRAVAIPLHEHDALQPGQRIRAGLRPRWLMMAAAALYLLPVMAFLAGSLAADAIWPRNDLAALCGGMLVVFLVVRMIRNWLRSQGPPGLELIALDGTIGESLESRRTGDHLKSQNT